MKRISKLMSISLLSLISGFVMEVLSILMFNGDIWSNFGRIEGSVHSSWPIHVPNFCFCVPIYRSAYYFHFFVLGMILIGSAIITLSLTLFISYLNTRKVKILERNELERNYK